MARRRVLIRKVMSSIPSVVEVSSMYLCLILLFFSLKYVFALFNKKKESTIRIKNANGGFGGQNHLDVDLHVKAFMVSIKLAWESQVLVTPLLSVVDLNYEAVKD